MSNTVKQLGFIPTNRGEFDTTGQTRYYKDNVVQYRNGSYICTPVGYSSSNPTAYTTDAPYQDGDTQLNANWKLMASVGLVDAEPTTGSDNLVKSGGVYNELALGAVYDVSAKNPTAGPNNDGKWGTLSALLSDANLNTLIPTSVRKGGMSIKFVCSSDNKYVQYRFLLSGSFTDAQFANPANWEEVSVRFITAAFCGNKVPNNNQGNDGDYALLFTSNCRLYLKSNGTWDNSGFSYTPAIIKNANDGRVFYKKDRKDTTPFEQLGISICSKVSITKTDPTGTTGTDGEFKIRLNNDDTFNSVYYYQDGFGFNIVSSQAKCFYENIVFVLANGKMCRVYNGALSYLTTRDLSVLDTIDSVPFKDSDNIIDSKGVAIHGGAFDVSEYRKTGSTLKQYATLKAAIDDVPTSAQRGGMSIKFIDSNTEGYKQARLVSNTWKSSASFWEMNVDTIDIRFIGRNAPDNTEGDNGDYALAFLTSNNNRIYKKQNNAWSDINDYSKVICKSITDSRVYYKNSSLNTSILIQLGDTFYSNVEIVYDVPTGTGVQHRFYIYLNSDETLHDVYYYHGSSFYQVTASKNFYESLVFVLADGSICKVVNNVFYYINKVEHINPDVNEWFDKVVACFGDSVTELNGGDATKPYTDLGYKWARRVANYLGMDKIYNRGIGGQRFSWYNHGGAVCWLNEQGYIISRRDAQNYDAYDANTNPNGWDGILPQSVQDYIAGGGTVTRVRGSLSSWLRIISSFPASIKDNIDAIFIQAHNDVKYFNNTTHPQFIPNDATDPEWAASTYYATYGGDYNISVLQGAMASCIMKLQAWMPNAQLILLAPISGRYDTAGVLNPDLTTDMQPVVEGFKYVHNLMSIPLIDVYGNDGINGLNRTTFISDTIHPYTVAGSKQIAAAVVGGLKGIILPSSM